MRAVCACQDNFKHTKPATSNKQQATSNKQKATSNKQQAAPSERMFIRAGSNKQYHMQSQIKIKNKKAAFEYHLEDRVVAGIELRGTEIKSIRMGKVSLAESYCTFRGDELFVINLHIAEYDYGTYNNHDPKRDRKLLLNRRELDKFSIKIKERGFSIIPTFLFINEKGLAKLEIALGKGKKLYDKRESIKSKDTSRDLERRGF